VCDPATASFALQAGGQVMEHQAKGAAVSRANRSKLKNFEAQNKQYQREVMFDNAEWKNDVQVQDIQQDQVYQAMVQQWSEQDQQLDKIFAKADQNVEKAIIEMYENEYAGTQTGRTAGRLAGKSAKKLGQFKSNQLHALMMSKQDASLNKERAQLDASVKSRDLYEKIRFSPIHGPTPQAPELQAKPGMGGLILGIAGSAMKSWGPGGIAEKTKADLGGASAEDIANIDKSPSGAGIDTGAASSGELNIAGIEAYTKNPNSSGYNPTTSDGAPYISGTQDEAWLSKIR
tara:strand:- start:489 stop:1355 length:867 start_codon:yes stop_codon:yes gene_type:complete